MSASDRDVSRETVVLDLPADLLEQIAEGAEDVPELIRDFLLDNQEEWFGVLESYSNDDRGTVDEGTIEIPDLPELGDPLEGTVEVHWEEFVPSGCRDFNLAGLQHFATLDFVILDSQGKIRLKGAVNEQRSTLDEF